MAKRPSTDAFRAELLRDAKAVIASEFGSDDLSLDTVAQRVATSRRQLQRCFQDVEGSSFRAHLTAVRMERAAQLLVGGPRLRVADVARAVGYRQPAHFTKAFRRFHGVNPSDYVEIGAEPLRSGAGSRTVG